MAFDSPVAVCRIKYPKPVKSGGAVAGYGYADEGTQMGASGVSSPCGRLPLRKEAGWPSFLDTRDIVIVQIVY